jgi:DNA-binding SARP family transcriptional activator
VSNNTRVQVAVLGPLRIKHDGVKHDGVKHDGAWCSISAPMERKVLALLLSRAGQLATTDWLIGHLWQERAPVQATNTLQTYVSHLRPMLEPDREPGQPWRILRREPNGYLLDVTDLDSRSFGDFVEHGTAHLRAGDLAAADTALSSALALWRGEDAFADVNDTEPVQRMIDDLAIQRLSALKTWFDIRIRIGRPESVLSDLVALRLQHRDDEELVRLMMLALHGSGRTADALRLYTETSRRLREELGADPGRALNETHGRLLDATAGVVDPSRRAVAQEPTRPAAELENRKSSIHRRSAGVGAAILVGVAVIGSAAVLVSQLREPSIGSAGAAVGGSRLSGALTEDVYSEFDLPMSAGTAHDLDVTPGQSTVLPIGQPLGSPQSNRGDLYRQKDGVDRLAGWPSQRDGSGYNTFEPVGRDTDVLRCRAQTDTGRGNMSVVTARVGDKACLHTHGNRWALLTIVALPEGPQTALTVHVVVLKPVKSP